MKLFSPILLLFAAFGAVLVQSGFDITRKLLGVQVDLLTAVVVYASLTGGPGLIALVAGWGGLCYDALSANPLGTSVMPLFFVGFVIYKKRNLILHNRLIARVALGAAAGAAIPTLAVLLLLTIGANPLIGWGSIWQLAVLSLGSAVSTPVVFKLFEVLNRAFAYQPVAQSSFRPDREIRRGRALKVTD